MAADFLESNLLNPTAPSEQSLKEAKLRKINMEEIIDGRLNKNKTDAQIHPRKILLYSLLYRQESINNNKNDNDRDQPQECLPASSSETPVKNISKFNEAVPLEVLLQSTNLRHIQKRLINIDMNTDTYCKIVLREKTRSRIEILSNKSIPLSTIDEDGVCEDTNIPVGKINKDTAKNKCLPIKSEESSNFDIDSHTRNLSYAQKNLLYKLHYLFKVNSRGGTNKDDKILLVGENNSELDLHQQKTSKADNTKKKNELRYFLAKRIQNLWHKWIRQKNKDAILVEVPAPTKKKRRLRKKNVYRTGRRLGKSVVRSLIDISYASPTNYYKGHLGRAKSFDAASAI
ncbi:uncharacterized protein [Palaemon carinicauda]|uniref:uncharacterized protein isoform X2 n=1 Tax=Palaemon carinicauda TaxID=392227 RepID=UPI0035B5E0B0